MNVLENIYPVLNNKEFIDDISNRFEFNIPVIKEKKTCENDNFKLASYQIFLKNYISNETPYNSVLIYHGTGTGKTCSAISIAENYRDVYHRKGKRIIILSSGNIKQGWYNNIYNPKKIEDQCTGSTYKYLGKDLEDTKMKRDKLIKKYYEFFGYLEFANRIKEIYENDEGNFEYRINKLYSDRVLIIDEAHNIRGDGKEKSDDNIKYLKLLLKNTRNLKLILLSATPMYNKAVEITELLSLLYVNDKRDDKYLKELFKDEVLQNERLLIESVKGYVSYVKGGTDDKFPTKLYPTENIINISKDLPLYECKMNNYQSKKYLWIYKNINMENKLTKDNILTQCSNIIYPNESTKIDKYYGKEGLKQIINYNSTTNKYKYKAGVEKIFTDKNIVKYSTKISMLLENIKNSEGIVFVYSQYIKSGILPIMLALEENGYSNYSENILETNSKKNNLNYIAITANQSISKNKDTEIEICRSWENRNGEKIKIILGSNVATEGLDLKNIREIYIFDPWYHLKKLEQIIGRGIRYCSHKDLDEIQNNTKIYIFVSTITDKDKCIDLEIYDLATKKNDEILKVENILQENAIDVELFKDINKPTKLANKDKCKKTIKKNTNSLNKNNLENMYNVYKIYIKEIFKKNISCNIETIIKKICENTDSRYMNNDLLYLTLKDMVDNKYIIIYNNNRGYLVYINKNYIFQPIDKKDNYISIYDREKNNKILENKYINLTIKKREQGKIDDISEIDVENILDKNINKFNSLYNNIAGFNNILKYHICIERLNIIEKRKLIEDMIDDKLDIELKDIVFNHFKTNIIDTDYNLNTDKKSIGYILFEKNTKKGIKKDEKDIPIIFIKNKNKYDNAGGIEKNKILAKIKKDKINTKYYIYNYKDIQNKSILKINTLAKNRMTTKMCSTQTVTKGEFQEYFSELYEKYIYIFDKYSEDINVKSSLKSKDYCMLIEILLRIETNKGPKYHYNYDEYMILI